MSTVLLEIGTEEMPASYLPPALAQLAALARARMAEERIGVGEIATWGTPRRIVCYLTDVAEAQAPAEREVRGPAARVAFAEDGEPTQAAMGFARSLGLPMRALRVRTIGETEFLVAVFHDDGLPTAERLPDIFADLITGLSFPRTMRWGSGSVRFARPVRWIVALQDDRVIPVHFGDVTAGRLTRGHRFLAPGEVAIPTAADYRRIIDENHVLVVPEERRERIREQLDAIAGQDDAVILDDGTLLEEATFRLEYPTAIRCPFDERFLSLPREVLIEVLRHEQHFFPLATAAGTLLPAFIGLRNGDKAYLGSVREGFEAVARAKLLDALFFFEQDAARALGDRVDELRGIIFQEHLGTLYDKAARLHALAGVIAGWLDLPAQYHPLAARAALLCKVDRLSALVADHPALQGVIGGVYARQSGEAEEVAAAIGEHNRPLNGEPIPASALGRVVALADKADTVAACFAVGLCPGDADPFGVRQAAQGIVRILAEGELRLSLTALLTRALAQVPGVTQPGEDTLAALRDYFDARLADYLRHAGVAPAVCGAVLAVSADLPADALARAQVISRQVDDLAFHAVIRAAVRLSHLRPLEEDIVPADALLTEPAERDLLARYQEIAPRAEFFAARGEFRELPDLLAALTAPLTRCFTEAPPAKTPARHALLHRNANLFNLLGDLSRLG